METPKHQKETEYTPQEDGSIEIDQKSYYDKLALHIKDVEKPVLTSFFTLKKDVERALDHVIEDGSPRLVLTIKVNKGKPYLTKQWRTLRKDYPRK